MEIQKTTIRNHKKKRKHNNRYSNEVQKQSSRFQGLDYRNETTITKNTYPTATGKTLRSRKIL